MFRNAKERRLVVVDVENIAGGAINDCGAVDWVKRVLMEAVDLTEGDHIVVGTSEYGLCTVGCRWPNVRYVARSGKDGADLALLEVLDENVENRFNDVVVASGDHIFTAKVSALVEAGVRVTVVGRRGRTSYLLAHAASHTVYVDGRYYPEDSTRTEVAA